MFDIKQYPEILLHVKSISKICKPNPAGWYECFCIYCDDSTRNPNPKSGHFHLSPTFPFAHCFRCGIKVSLEKYLLDSGFKDYNVLNELKKFPIFTYSSRSNIINYNIENNIKDNVKKHYIQFIKKYPEQFKKFRKYIYDRCLDINPIDFLLIPNFQNNILQINFINSSGELSMTRNLSHNIRYLASKIKKYYFFQNISKIDEYENITIAEGAFDIINLYQYNPLFKNNFFICIGGINYQNLISDLITNFLLIGEYNINVVFDKNVFNTINKINSIKRLGNILNTNINFNFYIPTLTKDVSDFMQIKKIQGV